MRVSEQVQLATDWFYGWEWRGRGSFLWETRVEPEPPFIHFVHHPNPVPDHVDDGRVPGLFDSIKNLFRKPQVPEINPHLERYLKEYENPKPIALTKREELMALQLSFPQGFKLTPEHMEQLLIIVSRTHYPLSFELVADSDRISVQLVSRISDTSRVQSKLHAIFPQIGFMNKPVADINLNKETIVIHELCLSHEFMLPIQTVNRFDPDPLASLYAVLDGLKEGQSATVQVQFKGVVNDWSESMYRSVTDGSAECFFMDSPEMLPLTQEKIAKPLFGVVIRLATNSQSKNESEQLCQDLFNSFIIFKRQKSNSFSLVHNDGYDSSEHLDDLIWRQSQRSGMILNSEELSALMHFPSEAIHSKKLNRQRTNQRPLPKDLPRSTFIIGTNEYRGDTTSITLSTEQRLRHCHVIGATGTGKSTLMRNMVIQDIHQGKGLCLLDPHGDLIDGVLDQIPKERIKDVVVLDPSQTDYAIGLNLLHAKDDSESIILSSDLVDIFKQQASSWGDVMTVILSNAIDAFVMSNKGGTLFDLKRFLVEASFRKDFLKTVKDEQVLYFWKHEFATLRKNAVSPILIRLNAFLRPKPIRNLMMQEKGLDFDDIINSNKILLVKLAQGLIGESNSYLLGSLIVSKIHQASHARQGIDKTKRKPYFFYLDEFQNFLTPSMASILSGSRKYGLGLVLAHQDLEQLFKYDSEIASSVLSNPSVRICFRVGDVDARKLEKGFAHFDQQDLQQLGIGQAIMRIGRSDWDFNLSTPLHLRPPQEESYKEQILSFTQERYAFAVENVSIIPSLESDDKKIEEESFEVAEIPVPQRIERAKLAYLKQEAKNQEETTHRKIQKSIKNFGEENGFKATIEATISNTSQRVDVLLEQGDLSIACEVANTNTVEYEVENIRKSLKAGYTRVLVVSHRGAHLLNIQEQARTLLTPGQAQRVVFIPVDQLSDTIAELAPQQKPQKRIVRGYAVEVEDVGSDSRVLREKLKQIVGVIGRGK